MPAMVGAAGTVGWMPDAVMAAAVLLEHLHAGPPHPVATGQRERIDVAVGAGGGATDDLAEAVRLDDAHEGLRRADRAHVGEERRQRGGRPGSGGSTCEHAATNRAPWVGVAAGCRR
jgi:hypothetical protein